MPQTIQKTLNGNWTQITDGSADVVIQFYCTIDICNSASEPPADAPALRFSHTTLTITRPDIAWARTTYADDGIITLWS